MTDIRFYITLTAVCVTAIICTLGNALLSH